MFISLVQFYMLFYNMVYELANEIYSSEEEKDHCSNVEKTPKQRLVRFVAFLGVVLIIHRQSHTRANSPSSSSKTLSPVYVFFKSGAKLVYKKTYYFC